MKQESYWLDLEYKPRPALEQDINADVVVIGGGIGGVSAAFHCASKGLKTVLIEKETIASGSAGKNGGMVVEGIAIDFKQAIEEFGIDQAIEIWSGTIQAKDVVVSLIQENNIDCDLFKVGSLYIGSTREDYEWFSKEIELRERAGFKAEILQGVPRDDTFSVYNSKDCIIHPVKYVRGLAGAGERYGLQIYENTLAINYDASGVITSKGRISAKNIIVAIESSSEDFQGKISCELGLITEPILEWDEWKTGGMLWTSGSDYISARKIEDRLFLNHSLPLTPSSEDVIVATDKAIDIFCNCFSRLTKEQIKISHQWTGLLAYPASFKPLIHKAGNFYEIVGHGGTGLTNGTLMGKLCAEDILGNPIPEIYLK